MENISYPRLLRRVQAVLIDSLIVPVAVLSSISFLGVFEINESWVKAMFLFFPIFILEPFLVSFYGGTIGHYLLKLKVRKIKEDRNINIVFSTIRFMLKFFLGWISLVLVLVSKRHQAVHDYLVGSIVVNKSNEFLPNHEDLPERIIEESGFKYPSKTLRLFMILVYWMLATAFLILASGSLQLIKCSGISWCVSVIQVALYLISMAWFFSLAFIVVYCWRSRLYGCRKKIIASEKI